ncbi:MAG: hypothetical protein U0795_16590 [Pirellulales bacterium]
MGHYVAVISVLIVCLVTAYFVRPVPDYRNLGWFAGMMDNPLRYSDNINRTLLFASVLLVPGRFLVKSVFDLIFVCRVRSG